MIEWSLRDWTRGFSKVPDKITKAYYYSKISRLATGQFGYKVKDLLNPETIEKYLWLDGRVMIWKSPIMGWIVSKCIETGYDINGFANRWRPQYDVNDSGLPEPPEMGLDDDCIVIYDLPNRMFNTNICCKWIEEISDINETIKTQVFNQKTPLIAVAKNPKDKEKLKNAIVNIANNVKALILDENLDNSVKALSIESPFNISDLQAYLKNKESEMLEFLGIDSQSSYQKKERLITDEQESNNQILSYLLMDRYNSRLDGCEKLRNKGLEIEVYLTQSFNPNPSKRENDDKENESI